MDKDKDTKDDSKSAVGANLIGIVNSRTRIKLNKKTTSTALVFLLVLIILASILYFILNKQKHERSNKLVSNISQVTKSYGCQDGLKKLGDVKSVGSSSQYTNQANEQALDYLMHCELLAGNVKQSLVYADKLGALYTKEGNTQKRQEVDQTIKYIKSFEGP
jgi:hypothetical protein